MPDQIPTTTNPSKPMNLFILLLLALSVGINAYLGYYYYKYITQPPSSNNLAEKPKKANISATSPLNILPVSVVSKTVQDVKVIYKFNVSLTKIASSSAGIKLITTTPNGSTFNYDLTPQTKITSVENQPTSTSNLKIGQNLSITSEYNPKIKTWQTQEVNIK